jgi:hypothetical protein
MGTAERRKIPYVPRGNTNTDSFEDRRAVVNTFKHLLRTRHHCDDAPCTVSAVLICPTFRCNDNRYQKKIYCDKGLKIIIIIIRKLSYEYVNWSELNLDSLKWRSMVLAVLILLLLQPLWIRPCGLFQFRINF